MLVLEFQVVPDTQLAVAVLCAIVTKLLIRKNVRPSYGTLVVVFVPELPLPTIVFAVGVFDVTDDVPTGLVVLHVRVTLQLLAPATMLHEGDCVRMPVVGA